MHRFVVRGTPRVTTKLLNRAMSSEPVVLVETKGKITSCLLNRPKALNSLNPDICNGVKAALRDIHSSSSPPAAMVVKGAGKAFCAGGDVKAIWEELVSGEVPSDKIGTGAPGFLHTDFFREEYEMNYMLGVSKIPQVSLWDGFVMGGGVGISVLGKYRVATEKTMFAMPETAIGLFPDVGSSYWLPHLENGVGYYVGLTGVRLFAKDLVDIGVATHFVSSDKLEAMEEELAQKGDVEAVLANYQTDSLRSVDEKFEGKSILGEAKHGKFIKQCFDPSNANSVEDIVRNLKNLEGQAGDGGMWATETLELLGKMSPSSVAVTFKQLQEGRAFKAKLGNDDASRLKACLEMEYRIAQRCMAAPDFREGIRAVLVDKDHAPKWAPKADVGAYFAPLEHDMDLSAVILE